MGFFKWIKRELDAPGSCKRRQSEPPIVYGCLNSNSSRDESYIRAIFKFNEWRKSQRTQNSRYSTGKMSKRRTSRFYTKVEKDCTENNVNILNSDNCNDIHLNSNGVYEEIRIDINNRSVDLDTITKKDCNSIKQKSKITRRKHKRRSLYENETLEPDDAPQTGSPPTIFYRENSNPFFEFPSPNKCPIHGQEVPSSNKDIYSICTRLEKDCNHNVQNPLPDVLTDHNETNTDGNRSPLAYQKIINIRGEEVEYALPYSEKNLMESQTTNEINTEEGNSTYDNVPDEIRANEDQSPERSALIHPFAGKFSGCRRSSQILVTDLDNSNGPIESLKGNIFRELNSLEMWSKNISLDDEDNKSNRNSINETLSKSSVIVCRDMEISEKNTKCKENQTTPVFIRPGRFRRAAVSKYYIHHSEKFIVEKGLHQNFLIMRKIRHPNISLLMATVCDVNQKCKSLILEPFSCSLYNLIYESGIEMSVKDCLDYTTQISKAVVYLHANGIIHSDISNNNIFICQYNKQAKLSSFQLTTFCKTHIQKEISCLYTDATIPGLIDMPTHHLPYFIEYRKIFSKHYYQAPELITSQSKFVFPCKQSDVYGITICLWEMLNRRIPFALFSYYELEKIFYLKQAQLPNFETKRCSNLDKLLESGLRINPNDRVQSTEKFCRLLQDIKANLDIDGIIAKNNQKNFDKVATLPDMNVCTSTIKRKTDLSNCTLITSPHFEDDVNKNCIDTEENNSNPKNVSKEYLFKIDQISLPETPIARQNKIRRTAWLTNKIVSPYNASPGGDIEPIKKTKVDIDTPPSTKKYNINITIMHSDAGVDELASPKQPTKIQSQIQYWNSLTSPLSVNFEKTKNSNKDIRDEGEFGKSPKSEQTTPKNYNAKSLDTEKALERKKFPLGANYCRSMPEMLNEYFNKKDRSADEDFEKVFWKREKERCEKNTSPSTPRRTSVKEAVHKFEQISSGASISSPFPKTINSIKRDKNSSPLRSFSDGLQNIRRNLNLEKKNRRDEEENQMLYQEEFISIFDRTQTDTNEASVNVNDRNQICANELPENIPQPSFNEQSHSLEQYSTKVTPLDIENQEDIEIISKLNVVLRNNLNKNTRKSRSNPELNKIDTVDARIRRSTKKLVRRASDVGCVSQRIIQTTREVKTANDSIGSTELREQITLFSSEINFNSPQLSAYRDLFLKNSQVPREICCRDCGSHNVQIGDNLRRYLQFQNSQLLNSSMDVSRVRSTISTVNESLEDLYIDDDLNYGPKLAPNMKLTKPELSLFSAVNFGAGNFNTSSISSSDLKLSDESLISNEDNGHN